MSDGEHFGARGEVERFHAGRPEAYDRDRRIAELEAEVKEQAAQLAVAQQLLYDLWAGAWPNGYLAHDDGCPGDDTCECEVIRELNTAMEGWRVTVTWRWGVNGANEEP